MSTLIKYLIRGILPMLALAGCTKSAFEINNSNPNTPSSVDPGFVLSAALTSTAKQVVGGDEDFANYWMGYWAVYGITSSSILTYNITSDFFPDNWDDSYTTLENYKFIADESGSPDRANFLAIAKIMSAFHFQRLVDLYNNVPYKRALDFENKFPEYDDAKTIYRDLVVQLDSAVGIINASAAVAEDPGSADVLFKGDMEKWTRFANTLKLKILMRQTEISDGPAYIAAQLQGLTSADFLGEGENAGVNPGYSNSSQLQQSPRWQDVGYSTSGSPSGSNQAYRACTYSVSFYASTNDSLRNRSFYAPNGAGIIKGRIFGSSDENQSNTIISGIGDGVLQSPSMDAVILPATESFFLQSEAVQRGFMGGDAVALYKSAVKESFRLLKIDDYAAAANAYTSQPNDRVNLAVSSNKINTIILQKWAALNAYDAVESWSDWRRLNIPADLPVSIYPGTTTNHIPYRLFYPTSEYSYNAANANAQGTINQFTSKIFWMP